MRLGPGRIARTGDWLKRHGFSVLYAFTVLTLALLIAWWSAFISHAIAAQRELELEVLSAALQARLHILLEAEAPPPLGPLGSDLRFEVLSAQDRPSVLSAKLAPRWPDLALATRSETIAALDKAHKRQRLMVAGESGTLLLAIIFTSLMLYRSIRLERRSYRELHAFWGRMTHELKTPITGLKAFLQTLQSREFNREELAPLLEMALREVERQEMLAENLLVGQRLDRHGLGLQLRQLPLAEYLRRFLDDHRALLVNVDLSLRILCPDNVEVCADPDALRVILENLIDNALKYGGKPLDLQVRAEAKPLTASIEVRDKGIGIEPKHREHIFEAYHRLSEQPRGKHGTGMGLYISRQLARKMGGDLRVHSAGLGKGSTFIILLRRQG